MQYEGAGGKKMFYGVGAVISYFGSGSTAPEPKLINILL